MKLGVRLHDLESGTIDQVIDKCHQYGFTNVQLVFKKALKDENGNPLLFNEKTALEVGKKFKENNINIAMLGAYFNPVHSNKVLVENSVGIWGMKNNKLGNTLMKLRDLLKK